MSDQVSRECRTGSFGRADASAERSTENFDFFSVWSRVCDVFRPAGSARMLEGPYPAAPTLDIRASLAEDLGGNAPKGAPKCPPKGPPKSTTKSPRKVIEMQGKSHHMEGDAP